KIMIPVVLGRRPVPLMAKKLANISPMKPTYDRNDVGLREKHDRSSMNPYPIKKDPSDARETSREPANQILGSRDSTALDRLSKKSRIGVSRPTKSSNQDVAQPASRTKHSIPGDVVHAARRTSAKSCAFGKAWRH